MSDSFVTPWVVAHQALLSVEFSRQEYWSGLPFPFPGDLPNPEVEPRSPALQEVSCIVGRFFTTWVIKEAPLTLCLYLNSFSLFSGCMGRETTFSLPLGWFRRGRVYLSCQGPDIKNFKLCGLRGKVEDSVKMLKQEGKLPFFVWKIGSHSGITWVRKESWRMGSTCKLCLGAPLSPDHPGSCWHVLSHPSGLPTCFWWIVLPLQATRATLAAPSQWDFYPLLMRERKRDKCLASPVEMRTRFCLGNSAC